MKKEKHILTHIFFGGFSICFVVPLMFLISMSFSTQQELSAYGVSLCPRILSFDAYRMVFCDFQSIINAYKVSIFVTVIGTTANLLMCALVAYPLSREDYKYRNITSFFIYFTMLFNGGMATYYIVVAQILHLKDTIWVLILPLMASPWIIFLLRTFFASVPRSLFEAANIDGAGEYRVFFEILLPLSKPAMATAGLMIALSYWNDWYNSLLFIDDKQLTSLQFMLQQLSENIKAMKNYAGMLTISGEIPSDGVVAATCLIAIGPMLFIFMFFQKYFISGLTSGSVKE